MNFVNSFLATGAAILTMMVLLWIWSLFIRNSSIVDIFWGLGFAFILWLVFTVTPQGYLPRKQLIAVLVTVWGVRLALHISVRNLGKPEDFRYAKWREEHGARWWWFSLFQVFLLQGIIMWILFAPLIAAQTSGFPAILTPLDMIGLLLWIIGFLFEAISDLQLMLFKANASNRGKLLTTGLWRYTRHPNYFGEAVLWWGYYIIALSAGGWWTIFSPILMTYLLLRVSGVALLERTMKTRAGYEDYMERTNAFVPWFPRK